MSTKIALPKPDTTFWLKMRDTEKPDRILTIGLWPDHFNDNDNMQQFINDMLDQDRREQKRHEQRINWGMWTKKFYYVEHIRFKAESEIKLEDPTNTNFINAQIQSGTIDSDSIVMNGYSVVLLQW